MKNMMLRTCMLIALINGLAGCSYLGDKKKHDAIPPEKMESMIRDAKSAEQGRHTQPVPVFKKIFAEPTTTKE